MRWVRGGVALVLATALGGCGSAPTSSTPTPAPAPAAEVSEPPARRPGCPARTVDLGRHATFTHGVRARIRLCAVRGFASSGSESTPGSPHHLPGARRSVIVAAAAVPAVQALVRRAERAGVDLVAASSFRTHRHQRQLCREDDGCRRGDHLLVAPPGFSRHQSGLALDLVGTRVVGEQSCGAGRARDPDSAVWRFMEREGRRLGFVQYAAESWHWELDRAPRTADRC